MNAVINCKISLSKKLRTLLGKDGKITLVSSDLQDGKGVGVLSLISDAIEIVEIDKNETAIMITPMDSTNEIPTNDTSTCSNLFSSKDLGGKIINKIAAVKAPEEKNVSTAIKSNVEIPKEFQTLNNADCKKWISNMSDFIEAVNKAKNKKSDINVTEEDIKATSNKRTKMQLAVLLEQKQKEEAIDVPAYIVSTIGGVLIINDMDIRIHPNLPVDLSNFSAKKIAESQDIKECLKAGYIKFISPYEKDTYIKEDTDEEKNSTLEVFSNHGEAMDSIGQISQKSNLVITDEKDTIDITENNIEEKTEEELMMTDLTQGMPVNKNKTIHSNIVSDKQSSHSNTTQNNSQRPPAIRKKF